MPNMCVYESCTFWSISQMRNYSCHCSTGRIREIYDKCSVIITTENQMYSICIMKSFFRFPIVFQMKMYYVGLDKGWIQFFFCFYGTLMMPCKNGLIFFRKTRLESQKLENNTKVFRVNIPLNLTVI